MRKVDVVLFLRKFRQLTGGHLKHLDYLGHTRAMNEIDVELYLTADSRLDDSNPFLASSARIVAELKPARSYFVAGLDWRLLDAAGLDLAGAPVVNLIQHVKHARPDDPRYAFLSRPALRICVSPEVADAIAATGRANGDIVVIENGTDLAPGLDAPAAPLRDGVFIGGLKAPELARKIGRRLEMPVDVADRFVPRKEYLARMARSRLCILLPNPTEGFYLPALEAMALGVPVVVPDCIGNRSFCVDGDTCVIPTFEAEAIAAAARALYGDEPRLQSLADRGLDMARRHSLSRERESYQRALRDYLRRFEQA